MPAEPKKCPGCLKPFFSQRAHLAQTTNPLCQQLAKKKKSFHPGPGLIPISPAHSPSQQETQPLPTSYNPPPVSADDRSSPQESDSGDGQSPSNNLSCAPGDKDDDEEWNDEESDDEDDLDSTFESSDLGWEPPVLNDTDNMPVSLDDADSESGSLPPYTPPEDLRERTWVAPKIVKFPSPRAGKPIRSVNPTNNTYATRLRTHSDSNPYRPFASKIDWEVAQWAKLRGPSSTSLGDLLKIEGVTPFVLIVDWQVF